MADVSRQVKEALPTDALKDAGQRLLSMVVQRAAEAATERVTGLTDRLTDVSDNGGTGLREALTGRSRNGEGPEADGEDGGRRRGGLLSGITDKVKGVFGGGSDSESESGGGSGKGTKIKMTSIIEEQDIGLPLRTTYDLWTQFGDFPSYMKKVEAVDQLSDEKTHWKAQVFWSHREWEATILEQVPDSHIVWRSKGAKGHVDGAVSFTGLGPNLTRVLLVLEYWPQGFFERTGNLWRAQGRRARLEFKHFRRNAMSNVLLHQEDVEGWRGEIHDGEVVRTHEDALQEEGHAQQEGTEEGVQEEGTAASEETEEAAAPGAEQSSEPEEYAEEPADEEDNEPAEASYDDEYEEAEDEEEPEEADEYEEDYADEDYADEDEDYAGAEESDEDYADEDEEEPEEPQEAEGAGEAGEAGEAEEEQRAPRRRRTARRQPAQTGGRSR